MWGVYQVLLGVGVQGAVEHYLVMFLLLLLLGYGLRRGGVLTEETTAWLARLVSLAPLPALVLSALAKASFSATLFGVWGVAMLSVWLGMGLAWLIGTMLPLAAPTRVLLMVQGSISNTGFLGTPLIAALYNHEPNLVAAAVAYDMGVTSVMIHLVGARLLARAGASNGVADGANGLRRLAQMPVFWATALGYTLMLTGLRLPDPLLFTLERLGQTTTPLVLLAIGGMLHGRTLGARWKAVALIVGFKTLVMPLLMLGLLRMAALPPFAANALLLQSAMPTVMASAVYAAAFRTEPELASAVVVASTVVALALLPVWMGMR
ncbi:MAG: malate permease [Fimbriimonadales bacterium]|nr:MAG: malate permease [Fimbriimonadales bacterium]